MNKKIKILVVLFFVFFVEIGLITGYSFNSNNNPGSGYSPGGSGGVGGGTYWPVNQDNKSLRAVRIRVFRKKVQIASAYYSLAEDPDKCYSSASNVTVCATPSYNYASVNSTTDVICTSGQTINLGCIVAENLLSTWAVRSYDGSYLDNYFKASSYENLKDILAGMKYGDSNFNDNDVVIVEPATLVKCNNTDYFGTSTAMMKYNVSYRGRDGNVCVDNDVYPAGNFVNLFESMSSALKVAETDEFDLATNSDYTGFGYFRYDVSKMGYITPNKDLRINIKIKNTDELIKNPDSQATYEIRKGTNCSGDSITPTVTTSSGFGTISLAPGTYSVKEISHPQGYQKSSNNCVIDSVTISNADKMVDVFYEKNCDSELTFYRSTNTLTIQILLDLYEKYKLNGLLNFGNNLNNASCNAVTCNNLTSSGCLSANSSSNFSSTNMSCYSGNPITNGTRIIGFCKNNLTLNNNLGTNIFYANSGQFLIVKKNDENNNSYIQIYNENLDPVKVYTSSIATAVSTKTCYILNGESNNTNPEQDTPEIYFGGEKLGLEATPKSHDPKIVGSFNEYIYEQQINYNFKSVYLEKITGKVKNTKSLSTTDSISGYISKFVPGNETIDFEIKYNDKTYRFNDVCLYNSRQQIITFDNPQDLGDLDLEFRTIDPNNPFVRKPKSNWNDGSNKYNYQNTLINNYILNSTNSYGILNGNKEEPIYEITLNPNDIKLIRQYNKNNKYDNYEVKFIRYNGEDILRNSFLHSLESGILDSQSLSTKLKNSNYPI